MITTNLDCAVALQMADAVRVLISQDYKRNQGEEAGRIGEQLGGHTASGCS